MMPKVTPEDRLCRRRFQRRYRRRGNSRPAQALTSEVTLARLRAGHCARNAGTDTCHGEKPFGLPQQPEAAPGAGPGRARARGRPRAAATVHGRAARRSPPARRGRSQFAVGPTARRRDFRGVDRAGDSLGGARATVRSNRQAARRARRHRARWPGSAGGRRLALGRRGAARRGPRRCLDGACRSVPLEWRDHGPRGDRWPGERWTNPGDDRPARGRDAGDLESPPGVELDGFDLSTAERTDAPEAWSESGLSHRLPKPSRQFAASRSMPTTSCLPRRHPASDWTIAGFGTPRSRTRLSMVMVSTPVAASKRRTRTPMPWRPTSRRAHTGSTADRRWHHGAGPLRGADRRVGSSAPDRIRDRRAARRLAARAAIAANRCARARRAAVVGSHRSAPAHV